MGLLTTIIDLAYEIQKIVPSSELEITESSFQDARNYMVSGKRVRDDLGFIPQFSVNDGIEEVASLVKSHRITDVNLPRFSNVAALTQMFGR